MAEIRLDDDEKDAVLRTVWSFIVDLDMRLEISKPDSYVFIMMGYTVRMRFENVMTVSIEDDVVHITAFTEEQKRIMSQIFKTLENVYLLQDKNKNRKRYFLDGLGL